MSHHFFIGLGGTGGRILAELRKIIRQEYPKGRGEPKDDSAAEPRARLGYLYVDSSSREFEDLEMWRIFGESVQLEETQRLFIKSGDLGAAIRRIEDFKAIKPWIGDDEELRETFKNTNGTPGANQVRRYGRFLFANHARKFRDFVSREHNRVVGVGEKSVTYHICGTLAGGTGSGSIVDAALIVRELCPDAIKFPIFLYVLATDSEVKEKGVVTGNFYANQYAALQELNQLWRNHWSPHLLTGNGQRAEELRDRFQACYLITDTNQKNLTLSRCDQEQLIAEYLFHRSITLSGALMPDRLPKTWTGEDVAKFKEHLGQCYRFSSIGVKRWVVPTSEIREKLGYDFMASVTRQLLHNNWHRDHGYLDKPVELVVPDEIAKLGASSAWRLSDPQLLLDYSYELTTNQDPVKSWQDSWSAIIDGAANQHVNSGGLVSEKFGFIKEEANAYFARRFRERGVQLFYSERLEEASEYAKAIRREVERDFFRRWRNGYLGLNQVKQCLEWLKVELERREALVVEEESSASAAISKAERIVTEAESALTYALKWKWWFGGDSRVSRAFNNYKRSLTGLMMARTEQAALPFKRRVLEEAKKQIVQLAGLVTTSAAKVKDLSAFFSKGVAERCAAGQERLFDARHVREYNAQQVEQATNDLRVSKDAQDALGEAVRGEIERKLSPAADFTSFRNWLEKDEIKRLLEKEAYLCASHQHDILAEQGNYPDLLDAGIIDILRVRYGGDDEALRTDVTKFVDYAAAAYELDTAQKQPNTDAECAEWEDVPQKHIAVFLPIAPNTSDEFEKRLRERFERAAPHVDVVSSERVREITVIATDFFLSARFLRVVKGLKQRYEKRLAPDGATNTEAPKIRAAARREVHLEDFDENELTDLFLPVNGQQAATL